MDMQMQEIDLLDNRKFIGTIECGAIKTKELNKGLQRTWARRR
jgi:hypothetical protein